MKTLAGFPPRQDPGWGADQVQQGLALVGDERVHVDQGLDVGVAGGGVGGDESAVGVPDQDDGPGNGRQKVRQIGGVVGDAAQRVGRGVHGEAVLLQLPDDLAPAGSVRPGAVLQHDDGLGPTVPAGDVLSAGARGGGLGGGGQQAGHRKDRGDDDEAQPGRPCCTGEVHAFSFLERAADTARLRMPAAASLASSDCRAAPTHLPRAGSDGLPGGPVAGSGRRGAVRHGVVEHVS